ncbi:MAG: hypothetical protein MI975_01240 [Cytophagales bacterium]|nr:hypothetical protein [Cytophagales bacterium]
MIILVLLASSFATAQKSARSVFEKRRDKVDISDVELRLRLTDYFIRFAEDVEKTADIIYFSSKDREIKKAALMWKIYGISAMSKAINMPDPIASFFNAWPLAKQLIYFFEHGEGREVLGADAELALELCKEYESKLDTIIIDMTDIENHAQAEGGVEKWAINNPIEDFYFTRESTIAIFAQWIGEGNLGLGKSVATITEQVVELSNRLNLYVDMVPRQARWQVDYVLMNYLQDSLLITSLSTLVHSMDRITQVIEMTPDMLEYNREASLRSIDEQREKSLRLLIEERKAVIEEIRKERIEIVAKIIEERMTVLEEFKRERAIVLEEIDLLSKEIVYQSGQEIERIVDKIFRRLTLLTIVFGAVVLLSVFLYKKF